MKNNNVHNLIRITLIVLMTFSFNFSAMAEELSLLGKAQKALNSKILVPIAASIGTVYSGILFQAAEEQEKEAEKNIKKINKIMEVFTDSYAYVCQSRDDLKNPKCYCLNEDGTKNKNRSNSQTCQTYWASDDYNLFAKAKNYQEEIYNKNPTGCIDNNSNFDEKCACRKMINTTTGENACKKVTSVTANSEGATTLTQLKGLKDIEDLANKAAQGTANLSDLSETTLKSNAVANKQFADAIIKKLNNKAEIMPVINEGNVDKYANSILSDSGKKDMLASNSSAGGFGSMGSLLDNANQNLEKAQSKFKSSSANSAITGNSPNSNRSKKKEEFVLSSDGEGSVVNGFAEAEDKKYKYKNSDISANTEASLFEIINNRYVQSGLKRLFDVEEKK